MKSFTNPVEFALSLYSKQTYSHL